MGFFLHAAKVLGHEPTGTGVHAPSLFLIQAAQGLPMNSAHGMPPSQRPGTISLQRQHSTRKIARYGFGQLLPKLSTRVVRFEDTLKSPLGAGWLVWLGFIAEYFSKVFVCRCVFQSPALT